jgi:hypothetical protein
MRCSALLPHIPPLPLVSMCRKEALKKANIPDKLPLEPEAWVLATILSAPAEPFERL